MFGKGVYFADMSSKSASYCCANDSGGKGLLLLSDVELGRLYKLYNSDYHAQENAIKLGRCSTLGKGRINPSGWRKAGFIHPDLRNVWMPDVAAGPTQRNHEQCQLNYNEYIVYDVSQIQLRYLFFVNIY